MPKAPQIKLIEFDVVSYSKALRRELQKATNKLKNTMIENARQNLAVIPFKTNKVRLADSGQTSDADRKMAVINSIINDGFEWIQDYIYVNSYRTQTRVMAEVSALKGDFKDTHIGIYYEYGTGENADPAGPMHLALKHWNPYRPVGIRQPIVSRSRKVNGGIWVDIGGNVRKTTALIGGRRSENFISFVGEDLPAYHWFRRAFLAMKDEARVTYADALRKVNPLKYIKISKRLVLGKR